MLSRPDRRALRLPRPPRLPSGWIAAVLLLSSAPILAGEWSVGNQTLKAGARPDLSIDNAVVRATVTASAGKAFTLSLRDGRDDGGAFVLDAVGTGRPQVVGGALTLFRRVGAGVDFSAPGLAAHLEAPDDEYVSARPVFKPAEIFVGTRAEARASAVAGAKGLRVDGNRLVEPDGRAVRLRGLCIPSLEWSNEGDHIEESVREALRVWNVNVVRLPLSQERWFGRAPWQNGDPAAYRALAAKVVDEIVAAGRYVLIDLHWSNGGRPGVLNRQCRMPDADSVLFWRSAAETWANHPALLFDLYNEPHDVDWKTWRDGGRVEEKMNDADDAPAVWDAPGLQTLLEAVRDAGADNLVVAGGLDWAYDLTGILDGHALKDRPTGRGVAYSAHIYPLKRDWDGKVGDAAAKYPVFVGEFGADPELPPAAENAYTWLPEMLGYLEEKEMHWTAWAFHPQATPRMLQGWDYTPTPYCGALVRAALQGAAFECRRPR